MRVADTSKKKVNKKRGHQEKVNNTLGQIRALKEEQWIFFAEAG